MKIVLQRVKDASVTVGNNEVGKIKYGLLLLIGIAQSDVEADVKHLAEKCIHLRVFEDENGKMNRSLVEIGGSVLAVSQFTLLGDTQKGRRPSFINAASPEKGKVFYDQFVEMIRSKNIRVETGLFGAMMDVRFTNIGPATFILESK
jgi:D-tyrosyl-tRNA(Tyr) deacylase